VSPGSSAIGVAVVGAGYFGSGLLGRLVLLNDFEPRVVASRTVERAVAAFVRAGIPVHKIVPTEDVRQGQAALEAGHYVVTADTRLPTQLAGIDVIAEATGDLLVGTEVAHAAIAAGKHVVAANSDVQATVGPMLKLLADRAGVVYTDIEGDEPGLFGNLIRYCDSIGMEVAAAINGKGVLKRYATPHTQAAYAAEYGIQPWLATAAADGTKLNFEMTVVGNATGMTPALAGMHGLACEPDELIDGCQRVGLLDGGPHVDYLLGGRGVFVITRSNDPQVRSDFRYLKLGNGPYYVFHQPRVLVHYEAPRSITRAVRHGAATVAPRGAPVAETIAFAKRDLQRGRQVDGVGGFDTYGLIVRADDAARQRMLPIGVAQYTRIRHAIEKDAAITYDDVDIEEDNLALKLRREQDELYTTALRQ
jgi:predicted homoserine dehydrogenase-like protein